MVMRSEAHPRPGKPQRDANLREHPVPEACSSNAIGSSSDPARRRNFSAALQSNRHEIDDDRAGAKLLGTADCDLALRNRSVTSALGLPMSNVQDLKIVTYFTLAGREGSHSMRLMRALRNQGARFRTWFDTPNC